MQGRIYRPFFVLLRLDWSPEAKPLVGYMGKTPV